MKEKVDRAVSQERLKVTDKRMFNADGTLREEFRSLDREESPSEESVEDSISSPSPADSVGDSAAEIAVRGHGSEAPVQSADGRFENPLPEEPMEGPSFLDLVAMLAEPISMFLGDVTLPDGSTREDLQMARAHIDLLEVLRQKTQGNLSVQEGSLLEDLLYQLRTRYVQKRG